MTPRSSKLERRALSATRMSTDEQTTALQLDALRAAECTVIHQDAASGSLAITTRARARESRISHLVIRASCRNGSSIELDGACAICLTQPNRTNGPEQCSANRKQLVGIAHSGASTIAIK
jgi:hypothetical protein